ncbi:MAG: hypothetical protein HY961_21690 [Ignavibacteriae bacterium]|nr:hypothetical protein [Ignavibacteriota bacterium]
MNKLPVIAVALALSLFGISCSALKDFSKTLTNLSRTKFKLDSVNGFQLAGVPLENKTSLNIMDGAKLLAAFSRNELPATFTLNVAALNPNDGTGGTQQASATLTSLSWTLILDTTLTIRGDISQPIVIPGTGQQTFIPLQMNLDLMKFFRDKGYESIVNLALAIGGANKSPSRITLRIKPTVQTDFGPISYPSEIDVIDKEFR